MVALGHFTTTFLGVKLQGMQIAGLQINHRLELGKSICAGYEKWSLFFLAKLEITFNKFSSKEISKKMQTELVELVIFCLSFGESIGNVVYFFGSNS